MDNGKEFFYVYFAGALFNHKDLLGNAALAESIYRVSNGRFRCALPQNFENRKFSPKMIRDEDITNLIQCDLAVFNYDGSELDSGTVVEFMFAKFADIPSLILRTDFRGGGDCAGIEEKLPWNLMSSFYPRTKVLLADSSMLYKKAFCEHMMDESTSYSSSMSGVAAASKMIDTISEKVVRDLEELLVSKPIMPEESRGAVYEWLLQMPGLDSEGSRERIKMALERKIGKRLL